ncbi:MAG: transglutaminase family protein [Acidobacteriota bacterium]
MRYQVIHITTYRYDQPVAQCLSEVHLAPRSLPRQRVLETILEIVPQPAVMERRVDYYGNEIASFSIFKRHDRFTVTATSLIEVAATPPEISSRITWEETRAHLTLHPDEESLAAYEFAFDSPFVAASPELAAYGAASFRPGVPLVEAVIDLSHRIHADFSYKPKSTSIDIPLHEVLKLRRGVCQDFAHLMIGVLRSYHLAARYISGYLRSGAKILGAEASHAWVSVFIPGHGWLDLDPTNDVLPSEGHVTVAWGRDYGDVTPVKGISLGGAGQTVDVDVRVVPITGLPVPNNSASELLI